MHSTIQAAHQNYHTMAPKLPSTLASDRHYHQTTPQLLAPTAHLQIRLKNGGLNIHVFHT